MCVRGRETATHSAECVDGIFWSCYWIWKWTWFFSIYFSFCIVTSNYLYMCKQHIWSVNTGSFLNGVGKFICNTVGCRLLIMSV